MRAALALVALATLALTLPAGAITPQHVLVPAGRVALASSGPITAMAVSKKSIFVAEKDGNRVCEYTHAGNPRRCLEHLPTNLGPLEVTALAYRPKEPGFKAGSLYVASGGHDRIYRVDLHSGQVIQNHVHTNVRSMAVADYGVVIGRPFELEDRTDRQAFHRLTPELRPQWSFHRVQDNVLAESPWAPLAVAPDGDVYGAVAGKYEIARYSPTGTLRYTFGIPSSIFEDAVPQRTARESDWLELWSPIQRIDQIGDWVVVSSVTTREGRTWDVLDLYSLTGEPAVRTVAFENEHPVMSSAEHLYTIRKDEPGNVLYRWAIDVPEDLPDGGLVAALPPSLSPVRAASGMIGEVDWTMLRPYLESAYQVVEVKRSRPVIRFSEDTMADQVDGYLDPVGRSVTEAVGRLLEGDMGKVLRRNFQRATLDGAGPVTATVRGWDIVFEDPDLVTALRGELCVELRGRGYPCP